jgi:DNA-binding MarR family transcriptional regulator
MTDIISPQRKPRTRPAIAGGQSSRLVPAGPARDDAALMPFVELLFFAYRDFTGEADAALSAYGLGRAHHRVLHFVNRHPAIRVADLLELLKITKQSLSRVLRRLLADGWIEHAPGPEDRRERRLTLTAHGQTLAAALAALQTKRIQKALSTLDHDDDAGAHGHIRQFLLALIAENEHAKVLDLVGGGIAAATPRRLGGT